MAESRRRAALWRPRQPYTSVTLAWLLPIVGCGDIALRRDFEKKRSGRGGRRGTRATEKALHTVQAAIAKGKLGSYSFGRISSRTAKLTRQEARIETSGRSLSLPVTIKKRSLTFRSAAKASRHPPATRILTCPAGPLRLRRPRRVHDGASPQVGLDRPRSRRSGAVLAGRGGAAELPASAFPRARAGSGAISSGSSRPLGRGRLEELRSKRAAMRRGVWRRPRATGELGDIRAASPALRGHLVTMRSTCAPAPRRPKGRRVATSKC